jgi:internalin A
MLQLIEARVERFGARPTSRSSALDRTREEEARRAQRDPDGERHDPAEAIKPGFAPRVERELYVSYAWGDTSPEGIAREKAVDDFCAAAEAQGTRIIRDKTAMQRGDEILKFMDKLAEAEQVFVFLSGKYLKSPYCMYELFGIWRECAERGDKFRERTSFFVFPSAQIYSRAGIDVYTRHWADEATTLEAELAPRLRTASSARFNLMKDFQRYAAEGEGVLEYIRSLKHESDLDAFIADALSKLAK